MDRHPAGAVSLLPAVLPPCERTQVHSWLLVAPPWRLLPLCSHPGSWFNNPLASCRTPMLPQYRCCSTACCERQNTMWYNTKHWLQPYSKPPTEQHLATTDNIKTMQMLIIHPIAQQSIIRQFSFLPNLRSKPFAFDLLVWHTACTR